MRVQIRIGKARKNQRVLRARWLISLSREAPITKGAHMVTNTLRVATAVIDRADEPQPNKLSELTTRFFSSGSEPLHGTPHSATCQATAGGGQ
jgi:hypothetical protein